MPSPLGHALAGLAIGWSADAIRRKPLRAGSYSLAAVCGALAISPDFDFLYPPFHRMATHSLTAIVSIAIVALAWHRRTTTGARTTVVVACVLAYASHVLLDLLGGDTKVPAGIQLLWPFSDGWFISGVRVFRETYLRGFFEPSIIVSNTLAIARELLVIIPFAAVTFAWRRRSLAERTRAASWKTPPLLEEGPES